MSKPSRVVQMIGALMAPQQKLLVSICWADPYLIIGGYYGANMATTRVLQGYGLVGAGKLGDMAKPSPFGYEVAAGLVALSNACIAPRGAVKNDGT